MTEKTLPIVIAGNWKMNHGVKETAEYLEKLNRLLSAREDLGRALSKGSVQLILFPPAVDLCTAYIKSEGTPIATGAQNVHWEPNGAFTGEISVSMVTESGGGYALVGHSERRHIFGETVEMTARKFAACVKGGVTPVLCIGETDDERSEGQTEAVLSRQFDGAFGEILPEEQKRLHIAYEPVWAIGTGNTATPEDAESACRFIRERLAGKFGSQVSMNARILYGGSVKPENARELLSQKNIDGVLVGGASLDPESFLQIADAALS
ncbi:MAG: triose-phosphate isomerase [Thermovirgaceae bacterium]